jgi:hypothetical protein
MYIVDLGKQIGWLGLIIEMKLNKTRVTRPNQIFAKPRMLYAVFTSLLK